MGESQFRALSIAVQILEELPDELRPDSNIDDMREMLAGKPTSRDGLILTQAVATALAFRAVNAMSVRRDYSNPEHALSSLNNRNQEFSALFELARHCDAPLLGLYFDQACGGLSAAGEQSALLE
jgi:hypothetical protein